MAVLDHPGRQAWHHHHPGRQAWRCTYPADDGAVVAGGPLVITSTDIAYQVRIAVESGEGAETIDQDAVVGDIIAGHGLVDVDTIDADALWTIVARHDSAQA